MQMLETTIQCLFKQVFRRNLTRALILGAGRRKKDRYIDDYGSKEAKRARVRGGGIQKNEKLTYPPCLHLP